MRTILKGIGKLFCVLLSVLLVAVLVVGGWFGVQGYNMYQDAIEDMPIIAQDLHRCRHIR